MIYLYRKVTFPDTVLYPKCEKTKIMCVQKFEVYFEYQRFL